jgi:hypothetical protein
MGRTADEGDDSSPHHSEKQPEHGGRSRTKFARCGKVISINRTDVESALTLFGTAANGAKFDAANTIALVKRDLGHRAGGGRLPASANAYDAGHAHQGEADQGDAEDEAEN